jgi:hypothetical protein
MSRGAKNVRASLILLFGLFMLLPACIQIARPTQQVATPPVVVITQVVTEMIPPTPLPITPTIAPSATPLPPTITPTWDPLSAPIYYPLPDCVASRLHVGDKAMVSLVGGANGIRYGRDLAEETVVGYAQPGAILEITNGPWCSRGWLVWMVKTADGLTGYTPEGDGNSYWLLPTKK